MFPFQKGDLCFQVSNNNDEQDVINGGVNANDVLQYDYHHANYLANSSTSTSSNTSKYWPEKSFTVKEDNTINNVNEGKIYGGNEDANKRRMIHRETERLRRQEMATLYSSLRSILPLEYIKGKRSMSDHISEAAKYIKDLESYVKELKHKRDQLREICSSSTNLHGDVKFSSTNSYSSSRDGCNVSIHAFSKAIEIEICAGVIGEENPFPLSRVLKILNEEGLDVVSCVSSKLNNNKWIYVIHCQVENVASIDSCQLQWRLNNEIS